MRPAAPPPAALVEALVAHQRAVGAGPAAERAAAALGAGARAVVTGQQPGLFGGPLLVLHKALGALAHARRLAAPGRPVVAVFWVASDDHDWDEVNAATVIDASGQPRALSLAARGDGRSVGDVALDAATVDAALEALGAALPATDRARAAVALARPAAVPTDLGTWATTVLARVLGDAGLVFVTPGLLAPWAGDVFARLVGDAAAIGAAVRAEGERLRGTGAAAPLSPRPDEAPLFLRDGPGGRRRRVGFDGDRVRLRDEPSPHTRAGLASLVRSSPHLASADVVGRVLLQDALLPVEAYVAGPTEAAYLRQLAPAHAVLGLPAPAVVARPSAAWLDARAAAALADAGLTVDAALAGAVPAPPPPLADDADATRLRALADEAEAVRARLEAEPGVQRALTEATRALRTAADAHVRAAGAAGELVVARATKAATALRPRGVPQERALSPLSLIARHGLDAVRAACADLDRWAPTSGTAGPVRVVTLG